MELSLSLTVSDWLSLSLTVSNCLLLSLTVSNCLTFFNCVNFISNLAWRPHSLNQLLTSSWLYHAIGCHYQWVYPHLWVYHYQWLYQWTRTWFLYFLTIFGKKRGDETRIDFLRQVDIFAKHHCSLTTTHHQLPALRGHLDTLGIISTTNIKLLSRRR